mmetsp:Transcript_6878/g.11090  ORF Transcript_6878/g.11090 Transcript_6878/m.11090 type:complete len:88 (-) Transcript_6878:161-424(-)
MLSKLGKIEKEVTSLDTYVKYAVDKYKAFKFSLQLFSGDPFLTQARWVEKYEVPNGPFLGYIFWGLHLTSFAPFTPHGFCLFISPQD